MDTITIAYFGTPDFAAAFLEQIAADSSLPVSVKLVVTQPDKKIGRKQILTPTPVKLAAQALSIPICDDLTKAPDMMRSAEVDLALLYAYGEIISSELLTTPRYGFWNIHPSLLPKYRGAAPMSYPILLADSVTGVTLMQMDEKLDHGPVIAQKSIELEPQLLRSDLESALGEAGYTLFRKAIADLISGSVAATAQDHSQATFTRMIQKEDGYIPFLTLRNAVAGDPAGYEPDILKAYYARNPGVTHVVQTAQQLIYNLYRALSPWPGIWTIVKINDQDKRLKITKVSQVSGRLEIDEVQLEGKRPVDFHTFSTAYPIFT